MSASVYMRRPGLRRVHRGPGKGNRLQPAVAFDEGREHRPVGVDDAISLRPRTGRQQLPLPVTTSGRAAGDKRVTLSIPTELNTPRSLPAASMPLRQSAVPWATMSSPRRPTCLPGIPAATAYNSRCRFRVVHPLGRKNGVTALRHLGVSSHDSHGLTGANVMGERTARKRVADYRQRQAVIGCRAFCTLGASAYPSIVARSNRAHLRCS